MKGVAVSCGVLVVVLAMLLAPSEQASSKEGRGGGGGEGGVQLFSKFLGLSLLAAASRGGAGAGEGGVGTSLGDIWSDCSKPTDKLKITAVEVKPDPPVKGQYLNVTANLTLSEEVTQGNIKLNIDIDNLHVVDETLDLCATLPEVKLMCPLQKGVHSAFISVFLAEDIPPGHVTGSQYLMDQNSDELACVALDLKL